jgi:cytochrome c oxidase subunit 3
MISGQSSRDAGRCIVTLRTNAWSRLPQLAGVRWSESSLLAGIQSAPARSRETPLAIMLGVTPTSSLAAPSISQRVHSLNRPNMVSVGTIVWLSSELMFFAGLFAMFFTVKAQNDGPWPPILESTGEPIHLDIPYALVVTIILVSSSFTCQWGVFKAEQGDVFGLRLWYTITLIMGTLFVLGQANEYRNLIHEGVTIPSGAYGTVFYLTTGFHGLHVTGGLIAFIFLIVRTKLSKFTPAQATAAIVVSYYWHFVDVVWIGLFATIYFLP